MSAIIFLVFIAIFIFLLFGLFRIAEGRRKDEEHIPVEISRWSAPQPIETRQTRLSRQQPDAKQPKLAALQAMRRAGYDVGDDEYVRVTDIGLLEYRGTSRPRLLRGEQPPYRFGLSAAFCRTVVTLSFAWYGTVRIS
jgi:hypothetical protein